MFINKYWYHRIKLAKLFIKHYVFHQFHKIPSQHEKIVMKQLNIPQQQTLKHE